MAVFKETGFGMVQWTGEDIILSGGTRRPGYYGQDRARLLFDAYGVPELKACPGEHAKARLAQVELVVELTGGEPLVVSLINLEVPKAARRQGAGRRVVEAIRGIAPGDLAIVDIKRGALAFWKRLGTEFPRKSVSVRQVDGVIAKSRDLGAAPGF